MYNKKYILAGIAIFVVLFSTPFWLNIGFDYEAPKLATPEGVTECIESRDYMIANHMTILNEWRDEALREGKREYVATNGKKWVISLQNTCMECHANKEEFCDACHNTNSVDPYCWDCHIAPRGNE
ncbi:MAG: sulfate reduction electron transfer complex DsrMKJOP subunit DsrJ [Pseudomonadota bacterium]